MVVVPIRLSADDVDLVDQWAKYRKMNRSRAIRRWIENGLQERWVPLGIKRPNHRLTAWGEPIKTNDES